MLLQLQERRDELRELGAEALGVSVAADYQARSLRDDHGIGYPLLLDPDEQLKAALGFGRLPRWWFLSPATVGRYLASWRLARPGRVTGGVDALPGLVVVDGDLRLRYRHEGRTLADYPDVDEVIRAVADLG